MNLHTDLSARVVLDTAQLPWVASPVAAVLRRYLARQGGEEGQATSIVQYAPGAAFPLHEHPQGEEIYVLDGELEDEHGRYPAGTYLRKRPGSQHAPRSPGGCTLFVKLGQHQDTDQLVVRPAGQRWQAGLVPGLAVLGLHETGKMHTALVRWAPGTVFMPHRHYGGEEILVLEGRFQDEYGSYPQGSWLRNPHLSTHQPFSEDGCLILVKVGHLFRDGS